MSEALVQALDNLRAVVLAEKQIIDADIPKHIKHTLLDLPTPLLSAKPAQHTAPPPRLPKSKNRIMDIALANLREVVFARRQISESNYPSFVEHALFGRVIKVDEQPRQDRAIVSDCIGRYWRDQHEKEMQAARERREKKRQAAMKMCDRRNEERRELKRFQNGWKAEADYFMPGTLHTSAQEIAMEWPLSMICRLYGLRPREAMEFAYTMAHASDGYLPTCHGQRPPVL